MNQVRVIAQRTADGATSAQIAAELHVSEEWVEIIKSSDAYGVIAHDILRNQPKDGGEVAKP